MSALLKGLASLMGRIIPVGYFALMVYISYVGYQQNTALLPLAILVLNTLIVLMLLIRRDANSISRAPSLWVLSVGNTLLPLLFRRADISGLVEMGVPLQIIGLMLAILAILSLNRSLGIVPANRGIQQNGLYRVVRHPLYASELLALLGFTLCYPSSWNICAWIIAFTLQTLRAYAEESFLSSDPSYSAYKDKVRFRLVPHHF
jgi:protein-S-isoprenylcysteine O-methyltransferase Ste14